MGLVPVPLFHVDAFTDRAFAGNPAAVCLLDEPADEGWMQAVAAEINLSETAFLLPTADAHRFSLRWFTPTVEVQLCGHATLASAHVLWSERGLDRRTLRFDTSSGELRAAPGADGIITLDLPVDPATDTPVPDGLTDALGRRAVRSGMSRSGFAVVELASAEEVADAEPDLRALVGLPVTLLTAPGHRVGVDVVVRCFGPSAGIDEDPVTGSAQCALAPWWVPRLGRPDYVAHQLSRRGGCLRVRLVGDRVQVGGEAVTVLCGELRA